MRQLADQWKSRALVQSAKIIAAHMGGPQLYRLRTQAAMSRDALGALVGCSAVVIANHENARSPIPHEAAAQYARVFGVSPQYFHPFGHTNHLGTFWTGYQNG
jgi:Helix-turn-helix domain